MSNGWWLPAGIGFIAAPGIGLGIGSVLAGSRTAQAVTPDEATRRRARDALVLSGVLGGVGTLSLLAASAPGLSAQNRALATGAALGSLLVAGVVLATRPTPPALPPAMTVPDVGSPPIVPIELTPADRDALVRRFAAAWSDTQVKPYVVILAELDELARSLRGAGFQREAQMLEDAGNQIAAARSGAPEPPALPTPVGPLPTPVGPMPRTVPAPQVPVEVPRRVPPARPSPPPPPRLEGRVATCRSRRVPPAPGCGILPPYAVHPSERRSWRAAQLETGSDVLPIGARVTLLGSEAILDIESELTDDGTRIVNYIPNAGGRRHFFLVRYPAGARGPVEGWVESHNLAGL